VSHNGIAPIQSPQTSCVVSGARRLTLSSRSVPQMLCYDLPHPVLLSEYGNLRIRGAHHSLLFLLSFFSADFDSGFQLSTRASKSRTHVRTRHRRENTPSATSSISLSYNFEAESKYFLVQACWCSSERLHRILLLCLSHHTPFCWCVYRLPSSSHG